MLAVVDTDDNGKVEWDELVQFMCDIFKHIEREKLVSRAITQAVADEATADDTPTMAPSAGGGSGVQPGPKLSADDLQDDDATFGVARTSLSQQREDGVVQAVLAAPMDDTAPPAQVDAAAGGAEMDDTADAARIHDTADAAQIGDTTDAAQIEDTAHAASMVAGDGGATGDVAS